jgi:methionine sulfoxide reductase heme-binding subunit
MLWIWPWQDRNHRFSWIKAGAFTLVLLPALRTAWLLWIGDYGTVWTIMLNGLTYWSGVWATVVLLAALAVTPAAVILRYPALADARRMVGVAGLIYTLAHMVIYFAFRNWDWAFIGNDMLRTSMVVAALSTAGLIALGVTSLDAAIKYMGGRNWQRLHTTNYAITGLAVLHVVLARGTYAEQYALAGIFFWLMMWRVLARRGLGANATALLTLAVVSCLFAAGLEASFLWMRRGFDAVKTLGFNLSLAILDVGYPPAWQVLAFGVAVLLAFAGREVFRRTAASVAGRRAA